MEVKQKILSRISNLVSLTCEAHRWDKWHGRVQLQLVANQGAIMRKLRCFAVSIQPYSVANAERAVLLGVNHSVL